MKKPQAPKPTIQDTDNKGKEGYPLYPDKEDIFRQAEETEIDPEDLTTLKEDAFDIDDDDVEELDFNKDILRDDLDVPGSDLDDDEEASGNEDEENNYYSIGGDNHNDLEEDNSDEEF